MLIFIDNRFQTAHPTRVKGSILLLSCLLTAHISQGIVIIKAYEDGGNVIFEGSGSLDMTGAVYMDTVNTGTIRVRPSTSQFQSIGQAPGSPSVDRYTLPGASTPGSFGTGATAVTVGTPTGDNFGLRNNGFWVPEGYVGGNISFLATFTGANFSPASLGMTRGTSYTWTLASGDTIVLNVIPEPTTYIAVGGFAALAFFVWRRRKSAAAAKPATA